ncbi:hypothetical protein KIS4809_5161 [Bacillus sp. ZZV12-4809]|uniref:hypothetical protein n=2 Tax=unclassified Cytobacillus TaxID=2675268 RepID=UPI0013FBC663|nr:hypothetical protein [Cytobacillus sp. AMY 15.2]KAF0816065.1 hypothetical protein KIS4809_5161 [Bacillus sp. ZZV12-4809]
MFAKNNPSRIFFGVLEQSLREKHWKEMIFMEHFSMEDWRKYVKNELTEPERELYEDHLYICDECLEVYLEAMDEEEDSLPAMTGEEDFTNLVMAQISGGAPEEAKEQGGQSPKASWFERWFPFSFACFMLIGGLVTMYREKSQIDQE